MYPLPNDSVLGRLHMVEVFDFYDAPRLFLCSNTAGALYLGLWYDSSAEFETWLYIPVSTVRLAELARGNIDLQQAFAAPEDGIAFLVNTDAESGGSEVEHIAASDVSREHLPPAGDTIQISVSFPDTTQGSIYTKRVRQVVGALVGANLRKQTFEIRDPENGIEYAGRIAREGLHTVESATLNKLYLATIKESVKTRVASGREVTSYELTKLTEAPN